MRGTLTAFTIFIAVLILPGHLRAAADLRHFDDAPLRAVQFLDKDEGWAVGDEGVVWHTIDSGRTWERLATGVRASLRSVHFLNGFIGWVAGREEQPGGASLGVLLFTNDGGQKWQRVLSNAVPGINRVKFLDPKVGFVMGDGGDGFAAGVFRTLDGGKTREPVKGPRSASWFAGDFQDESTGVFAGAWTQLATLRDDQLRVIDGDELKDLGGRAIRGIQILPKRIVAVGQGGLVLTSVSGGQRYGFAELKLPADVLANLDCLAIHGVGGKAWVVGRPGSFVLHTADAGASWQLLKTGQSLPLNGVFFQDESRGWAVGELGTILATGDGGKTWNVQRQGGKRAALMTVNARPDEMPLDTLALVGGQEGYLTVGLSVTSVEAGAAALAKARDPFRVSAAVRQAGGASGEQLWHFGLPQHLAKLDAPQVLAHWQKLHGNRADQEILRQLVLALRTWRPDVVVSDHAKSDGPGALIAEALREAVKLAGDAKAFPEQLEHLGLSPWSVSKLYALGDKSSANVVGDHLTLSARLEDCPRDFAASAAALLSDAPVPGQRYYRLVGSRIANAESQRGFFDGLSVAVGDARRKLAVADKDADAWLLTLHTRRRNLLALAEQWDDANKSFSQIAPSLAKLPDDQAALAVNALAGMYVRRGQWQLAREAYLLMVDRHPAHPLAVDAYRWLIRHNSSSEARRRHEKGQFLFVTDFTVGPAADPKKSIQQVNAIEKLVSLGNLTETRQWNRGSLEIGKRLTAFGPLYAADPAMQMCMQAARRNLGELKQAQDWYRKLTDHLPRGPWQEAAAAELWLTNRGLASPKKVALCKQTAQKPFLDGKLDDACWQKNPPLKLTSVGVDTTKEHPTEAQFAYDQQYFYLAVRCKHPEGQQVPLLKQRPRDADLDGFDRISLLLDLDRDYSTYFRLEVDQRGQVREDCWGDVSWNPKWFVAVKNDADGWTVEAAIPLDELTSERIPHGAAWAMNVVRTLPGRGVQAWSLPADVQPRPEGMALLMFQQDQPPPRTQGPMPPP